MYTTYLLAACGGQKTVSDPMELELQLGAAEWALGVKPRGPLREQTFYLVLDWHSVNSLYCIFHKM